MKSSPSFALLDANITQIFASCIAGFVTWGTMTRGDINNPLSIALAIVVGGYYLGVCWNHTSGIPNIPKHTISAIALSLILPIGLSFVGLPLNLASVLFWAIVPWVQRFYYARSQDPHMPGRGDHRVTSSAPRHKDG